MSTQAVPEVACPKCGGRTWDNRLTKRNPKAPDFKCRDRACDGAIWPERDPQDTPATAAARASLGAPPVPAPAPAASAAFGYGAALPPTQQPFADTVDGERVKQEQHASEVRAAKKKRIDVAAARAAETVVQHVLPILAKAGPLAGEVVITIDAGRLTAAVLDAYTKAGIV